MVDYNLHKKDLKNFGVDDTVFKKFEKKHIDLAFIEFEKEKIENYEPLNEIDGFKPLKR